MKEIEDELRKLKREIQDAESERSELKGRKSSLLEQLRKDYSCKTEKAAQSKLAKDRKRLKELEKEITAGFNKLKEEYEW